MFSCKKAARLLSESHDRALTFWERLRLGFHLVICRTCRRFAADWKRFHASLRAYSDRLDSGSPAETVPMPGDVRQRILQALTEESQ
jgi:hypothetical protein